MLQISELLIGYTLVIILALPFGLLLVRVMRPQLLERSKIASVFTISLLLGIPFPVGVLWVVSQVSFSIITIILIAVMSYSLLIAVAMKYPVTKEVPSSHHKRLSSSESVLFAILLLIGIGYYGITAIYMGWPQVGDPWRVGTMVSLIVEHGLLPTTYEPISSATMGYPLGFPVLCAAVSVVSGCLPAVSLLIVASLLMGLVPVAIAWLVFWKEESLFFAALAFLLSFFLHPITIARYSLFYFFLNGTYTVMLGIVIAFASFAVISFAESPSDSPPTFVVFGLLMFFSFVCFIVYPPLLFVPSLALILWIVREMTGRRMMLTRETVLTMSAAIVILGAVALAAYFGGYFQFIFDILGRTEHLIDFHVADDYFTVGLTGILMATAVATAAFRVIRAQNRILDVVFLVLTTATLLSMHDGLYEIGLNILLPSRMVIMLTLWSYVYVILAFSYAVKLASRRKDPATLSERIEKLELRIQKMKSELESVRDSVSRKQPSSSSLNLQARFRNRMNRPAGFRILSLLLILLIMAPSLVSILSFDITEQKSWFVRSPKFADDLAGMLYIKERYGPSDLVLNYQSYSDLFLPSIGVLNVVFDFASDKNRAFELSRIWEDPHNSTLVRQLLHDYDVGVVYVSSVYSVIDTVNGTPGAHGRPLPQSEYIIAFDSLDFLEAVYTRGDCVVYDVIEPLVVMQERARASDYTPNVTTMPSLIL